MDQHKYRHLWAFVKETPDPRQARGKRHDWEVILTVICMAMVDGQKNAWAIGCWAKHRSAMLCARLNTTGIPSCSTIYRALRYLDVDALEAYIAAYGEHVDAQEPEIGALEGPVGERLRGQSVDGKEIRGANAHGVQVRLLGLVRHDKATILGQRRVAEGHNESSTLPSLLAGRELMGTVTTLDAMFTQRAHAQQILAQGGHYLMVVKGNQPTLYEAIETLFKGSPFPRGEEDRQLYCYDNAGHGRIEVRSLVSSELLNDYLDWPGIGQVIQRTCQRTIVKTGKTSCHTTYGITSLRRTQATAEELEQLWRMHWTIENPLHYVRDETLGEDRGQAWKGHTPQALAALRNGILTAFRHAGWANIADAIRYYSADLTRAMRLLGIPPS